MEFLILEEFYMLSPDEYVDSLAYHYCQTENDASSDHLAALHVYQLSELLLRLSPAHDFRW